MAKRRRRRAAADGSNPTAPATASGGDAARIDPDVARFAARVREQREAEQAQMRAAREARRRAEHQGQLVAAKDAAAAAVKALRARPHSTPEEQAAAEAVYRQALAALLTFETGIPPAWAPPADMVVEGDEPDRDGTGEDGTAEEGDVLPASGNGPAEEAEDGADTGAPGQPGSTVPAIDDLGEHAASAESLKSVDIPPPPPLG